jgi:energy-coupling factor transporter ATP-binding protein EcfA2
MNACRTPLAEMISLRPRFLRSVNLERDFHSRDAADGYLVTRGTLAALSLLSRGVNDPSYRAQCISGPYGSGKSALALFFAKLLEKEQSNGLRTKGRQDLGPIADSLLPSDGEGYVTVLATGGRENLSACLVRSLKRSLEMSGREALLEALSRQHEAVLVASDPSTRQVVALFEDLAKFAKEHEQAQGLIVIVDELGKLLEHAALNPDESDVQVLQELAEAASRSYDSPLWFITVIHQQFSQYASRLGRRHQKEWAKVQQRFFDIPCALDGLDALQLVAAAMNGKEESASLPIENVRQAARDCSVLAPRGSEEDFEKLCACCYPLHPTAVLLLPLLFKRFGQNERSLFSFLSADEPFSLSRWVRNQEFNVDDPPFVRLPHIYDYAYHTLIGGAPAPQIARAWAEAGDALARLGDATESEVHTLKTISLLNLVGDASRLPASHEVLELALRSPGLSAEQLREVLKSLEARRLIVYRRFRNAFRLYEGSDIDIGERLTAAYQTLPTQSVSLLVAKELCPAPPLVARKHSYIRGMLRLFSVIPASSEDMQAALSAKDEADGHIICCLVENQEQHSAVQDLLNANIDNSTIVMVTRETDQLAESARDVAALEWVKNNTPGLTGDRVARQELEERRLEASIAFRSEWNRLFTPGSGHAAVYWKGQRQETKSSKELAELVSLATDEIYPYAPKVQNELINRRSLSSAAAAARRNLIEAMLLHSQEEGLGLIGYPPERSIYESVLRKSGIHRQNDRGEWEFGSPTDEDPGLQKAWNHILEASYSESLQPKPLADLFSDLCGPPFGVADGFVPVLFYACLHAHAATMALYEDGTFVPEVTLPVMERLMRNPGNFSVLRFVVEGERAAVVERFAKGFNVDSALLPVIRSIYAGMSSLNKYVEITSNLPDNSVKARDAILRAKSPERLLFIELPEALGCRPFEVHSSKCDKRRVAKFFDVLNEAFNALMTCYSDLLGRIRTDVFRIFDIAKTQEDWRDIIPQRAALLSGLVTDTGLRTLMNRAIDTTLPDDEYLESIAAGIVGQPPNRWSRADEDLFTKLVAQFSAKVRSAETLVDLKSSLQDSEAGYLVTIDTKSNEPVRRVVRLSEKDRSEAERAANEIIGKYSAEMDTQVLLAAVAEAARRVILLDTESADEQSQNGALHDETR